MYIQNTPPDTYKRSYPTYKTTRLSFKNLKRIQERASRYKMTIDEIVSEILDKLQDYENRGYEIKGDVQHW
jgi:hypothetical protein